MEARASKGQGDKSGAWGSKADDEERLGELWEMAAAEASVGRPARPLADRPGKGEFLTRSVATTLVRGSG